jgi:hypothetical protein
MAQIVVEVIHTTLAVFIALVVLRTIDLLARNRFPALAGGLQYAIGQH